MNQVKEKLNAIRNNIDEADDREADAKYKLKEANERGTKAEENAESYKRRIALLTDEYNKTGEKIIDNEDKLAELANKIEVEQDTGKELEGMEMDNDDQLNDLEFQAKEAIVRKDEKLRDLNDISRKLTKTEYDLSRAQERCEKADAKLKESQDNLKSATDTMVKLEQKDEVASEREGEQEEKIAFMNGELKPIIENCEDFDQRARKLERYLDELTTDLEVWREKEAGVQNEVNEILNVVDDDL